jgi:hypothetical protein
MNLRSKPSVPNQWKPRSAVVLTALAMLTGVPSGSRADDNSGRAPAAATSTGAPRPPLARIEPGVRVGVLVRNKGFYTGVFVGVSAGRIYVLTNPNWDKPSAWELQEVQALQLRDGFFAYRETTGAFELALTYYRHDRASGQFRRFEPNVGDTTAAEEAQVLGPLTLARALLARGRAGELCIGVPLAAPTVRRRFRRTTFGRLSPPKECLPTTIARGITCTRRTRNGPRRSLRRGASPGGNLTGRNGSTA